eukprot:scaffold759_cov119-Isochrysis_galbana.AAC.2
MSGGACSAGSDDAGAMLVEEDGMDVGSIKQIHLLMRTASEKIADGERWSGAQAVKRVRELDRICSEIVQTEANSLAGSRASSCRGSEMGNSPRNSGVLGDRHSEPKRALALAGSPLAGSNDRPMGSVLPPRPFLSTVRRGRGSSKMIPPIAVHPAMSASLSGRLASGRVSKSSTGSYGDRLSENVLSENRYAPARVMRVDRQRPSRAWVGRTLHGHYTDTTGILQGHYTDTTRTLQGHYRDTTGHYREATGTLQGHYRDTTGTLQGGYRDTTGTLQGHYRDATGTLQAQQRLCGPPPDPSAAPMPLPLRRSTNRQTSAQALISPYPPPPFGSLDLSPRDANGGDLLKEGKRSNRSSWARLPADAFAAASRLSVNSKNKAASSCGDSTGFRSSEGGASGAQGSAHTQRSGSGLPFGRGGLAAKLGMNALSSFTSSFRATPDVRLPPLGPRARPTPRVPDAHTPLPGSPVAEGMRGVRARGTRVFDQSPLCPLVRSLAHPTFHILSPRVPGQPRRD